MRVNMNDVKAFILKRNNTTFDVNSFLCGSTSVWSGGAKEITETFTSESPVAFTLNSGNYCKAVGAHPYNDGQYLLSPKTSAKFINQSLGSITESGFILTYLDGYTEMRLSVDTSAVMVYIITDADKFKNAKGLTVENGVYCCNNIGSDFTSIYTFVYKAVADNSDTATSAEYFTFTELSDGTYSIAAASVTNMPETVIFPSTYNGKAVTKIADFAFTDSSLQAYNTTMVSAIIPEGITSIGQFAFAGCRALNYIELPYTLTTISRNALVATTSLQSIFIPSSVLTMGDSVFNTSNNENLTIYCEASSKPDGWNSNWNYKNTHPVVWGYKPTDDSYFTFTEQEDGTYSVVAKDSTNMPDVVGVPFSYNGKAVTALGYKAFNNCYNITKIVLPESIKTIGSTAFQNCEALTEVNIPSGVTEIGDYTFFNCKALTTVTIPSGVTSIGELAFANCSAMTSIVIPASVTTIGMQAFFNSRNLTINCEATEQPEGWVNGWNSSGLTVNWGYTG